MDYDKLRKLVDEGMSLSEMSPKFNLSPTTIRYHLSKINLKTKNSQFPKRLWTDEDLIKAVAESVTVREVIGKLGLSRTAAGNHTTVSKHVVRLGLDITHFTGKASGHGGTPRRSLTVILTENSTFATHNLLKRLVAEGLKTRQCEMCGLTEWLEKPISLELDHINGIPNDHRLENLRVLCPNCHSTTPTWRGRKNKK